MLLVNLASEMRVWKMSTKLEWWKNKLKIPPKFNSGEVEKRKGRTE